MDRCFHYWVGVMSQTPSLFRHGRFGLEKENLRVTEAGELEQSPHPIDPSDPYYDMIVKDFGESQLEMVTPPMASPEGALDKIREIQDHILKHYPVRLWPFSMPCRIEKASDIAIATFPDTTEGRKAKAYREMLAKRHGAKMQLISGVHYNFSFDPALVKAYYEHYDDGHTSLQETQNHLYFHVARNLFRYQWLLTFLYGASPFVDATYKEAVTKQLKDYEACCKSPEMGHTYYEDYATSLRMSRYGYHSDLQQGMKISYDDLDSYTRDIRSGIEGGILQKESEYYAPVRFKNSAGRSGSMLEALEKHGVEYIELRLFDLNPYDPYNITHEQVHLTHLFMLYCALKPSPAIDGAEMDSIYLNSQNAAIFGRKEGTKIWYRGKEHRLRALGETVLSELMAMAMILDEGDTEGHYVKSVESAFKKIWHKEALLSERLMDELLKDGISFIEQGIRHSLKGSGEKEAVDTPYETLGHRK